MNIRIWCSTTAMTRSSPPACWPARTGIGSTYNIMGWRYRAIAKAVREGDNATAQRLQSECNTVIDLLIKAGVFRGLKTVLHYMDVVSVPLCRKPFAPVDEKFVPALKALAEQLMAEKR